LYSEFHKEQKNMAKILVVDDAEFLRVRLTKMLGTDGYEVFQAENGATAVSMYKEMQPDVVLMDVTMPEMDGLTALKEIVGFDAKARVIMLTALGQESVVLEAVKSGARDFIVKPFEHDRVTKAITKLLA
jgi:two-component system chemotaxis response regulator CheY